MKITYSLLAALFATVMLQAQTPAGNCFRIDYDAFQADNLRRYFDCGNDDMLNTGDELTVEVWVQLRDLGDNQKIIGKFGLNNSGYLMGVDQGRIYPELWNPVHYDPLDGLMNPTAQHWHHLAFTFNRNDSLRTYINGQQVGGLNVANQPVSTNTDPLIIGIASWDLTNFQTFGNLDEVRIWNVQRSTAQIREGMFTELSGSENGLVAYYDFNQTTGSSLPDVTGNGNTGAGTNIDASEWVDSWAVIANAETETKNDLQGLWNGMSFMDPRVAVTDNGMTLLANGMDTADYVVFGHSGGNGTSTSDLETNVPTNFERADRTWTMTSVGGVVANVLMNLSDAGGSGAALDGSKPTVNYTLLYRSNLSGTFVLAGKGSSISNGVITFSGVSIQDGEYTIGVGDEEYAGQVGIHAPAFEETISMFPNPSNGQIQLTTSIEADGFQVEVLDITGKQLQQQVWNGNRLDLDLTDQGSGLYFVRVISADQVMQRSIIVR